MRAFLIGVVGVGVVTLLACGTDPCGPGYPNTTWAGFDISGASNSPCTLTLAHGGKSLSFDIATPSPPVADTSLDAKPPLSFSCDPKSGVSVAVTGPAGQSAGVQAWRSSMQLCVMQPGLRSDFYPDNTDTCDVLATLTCSGVTLYDQAHWQVCQIQCAL